MVYNFKGQVKVADVQKAFDEMVAKVNALRQKYDAALDATNVGLDVGQPTLAPNRYTLSVGGLKQIISDMQGQVIGARVYKYGSTYYISEGIAFTQGSVIHIPQRVLTGSGNYVVLNASNVPVRATQAGTSFVIAKINPQEGNGICDIVDAIADVPTRKIFCGNNSVDRWENMTRDANKDLFVSMTATDNTPNVITVRFNNQDVSWTWRTTAHNGKNILFYDHFYLPKNAPNPWSGTANTALKVFTPIVREK